jgi:hypothetical protein
VNRTPFCPASTGRIAILPNLHENEREAAATPLNRRDNRFPSYLLSFGLTEPEGNVDRSDYTQRYHEKWQVRLESNQLAKRLECLPIPYLSDL